MQMFVYTMACNSRKNSIRKESIVVYGETMAARDLELDSSAININETWRTSMNLFAHLSWELPLPCNLAFSARRMVIERLIHNGTCS